MVGPDTKASAYRHANDNKSSGTRDTKRCSMGTQFLGHIAPNSGPFHLCVPRAGRRVNGRGTKNEKPKTKHGNYYLRLMHARARKLEMCSKMCSQWKRTICNYAAISSFAHCVFASNCILSIAQNIYVKSLFYLIWRRLQDNLISIGLIIK